MNKMTANEVRTLMEEPDKAWFREQAILWIVNTNNFIQEAALKGNTFLWFKQPLPGSLDAIVYDLEFNGFEVYVPDANNNMSGLIRIKWGPFPECGSCTPKSNFWTKFKSYFWSK